MAVAARAPRPTPPDESRGGRIAAMIASYGALIALTILFVVPLLWMLSTALKSNQEATRIVPTWIPEEISGEGFDAIIERSEQTPVFRWFLNSMIAAIAQALLVVVTSAMAAYALARLEFPGKRVLTWVIISTLFIPPIIFLTPTYLILDELQWLDSLLAVIFPGAAGAIGVFLLRQFFLSIPKELEEAAALDNAGPWKTFMRVILPLSKPALATLFLLAFLTNWNDFLLPLFVLFSPESLTLPPGLGLLQGQYTTSYEIIMAGAVVATAPALALFILAQRFIIEGVSSTGIKG
ncbi:MAG TPA: carbohydrate ABC transporter permease [Candidatus Caenarcaniphilales bacterium]|nr:carbohydrate ABC transporter permease [Candidatus Caenarcaniphilales bacterium]